MSETDDSLVVNGVRFETKFGAMVAWRRIQGDSPDVFWETLLYLREECPADFEDFGTVERAWILGLSAE